MLKKNLKHVVAGLVVSAVALFTAPAAMAGAIDVSAVTTEIAAQAAPIALIGAAVLLIFVAVKAFKWVRRSL